jgi:poly-gamma-glutamate synthesis protein (capsule biosynthesis protein)
VEIFDSTPYFMTAYEYETYAHVFMKEAWTRERTWAIVAFEELHPRWKVIALDGQSPIHKSFKPETYPLTIPLSAYDEDLGQLERAIKYFGNWKLAEPFSNYHPDKLATVILTGVTAMARATAVGMDERGILVPGEDLADVLKEADILHISNEVPFAENCPKQSRGGYLVFCSPASYMELLRSIGTDVVELTGDHFQDYGSAGMLYTLDLYAKEGWPVYGGGKDIFDARAPIKLEVNGNKIAFLGCNAKSPNFAQASETSTGAYHCDMDYMAQTVKDLVEEGYLPIVTFQHEERYAWQPNAQMTRDFDIVLNAGAVIASGSQAHQPHFAEFLYDGFAHYGLGNLFFDQYGVGEYTHWAFIDRHVFYDGRHISTELLTIRFLDRVKATWASPEERVEMLEMLFDTGRMMWPGTKPWEQQ